MDYALCGPRISRMRSHSMAWLSFYLKKKNDFFKIICSRHLFLFYFLREKQIRKKNSKCDSYKGKTGL